MRIIDLFAGCGGFSASAHAAGGETCLAVEVDPILSSSFARNFPMAKLLLADVRDLSGRDLLREAGGPVDGIVGGPPCQGFSEIGRRDASDPRRLLMGEFFRLTSDVEPTFFIIENVRGVLFRDNFPILHSALARMHKTYRIFGPAILDACDFGAATKRPRTFVVGIHRDRPQRHFDRYLNRLRRGPETIRGAILDLANARLSNVDADGLDWWEYGDAGEISLYARGRRTGLDGTPMIRFSGHRRASHSDLVLSRFSRVLQGARDEVGKHIRLDWNGQSPTIRAGTGSDRGSYQAVRPIHPDEPRVITVREAARIQGFPDWFVFHQTLWHSFRMIGNSVSPVIGAAVLRAMADCLRIERMPAVVQPRACVSGIPSSRAEVQAGFE